MSSGTPSLEALQGHLQEETQWRGLPLRYKVMDEGFMSTKVDVQEWEWEDVCYRYRRPCPCVAIGLGVPASGAWPTGRTTPRVYLRTAALN
jgi:hypothetical protein